jgi:acetyl esterase
VAGKAPRRPITSPDPPSEPYFVSDFGTYPSKSPVEHVKATSLPLLMTFVELGLLSMQGQAGQLFARLMVRHGFSPTLLVIGGHNHLTQIYSVNTGDTSLTALILEFMGAARLPVRSSLAAVKLQRQAGVVLCKGRRSGR